MTKKYIMFTAGLIFLLSAMNSFAYDWKTLHERADAISLDQAEAEVKTYTSEETLYVLGLVCLNLYDTQKAKQAFTQMLELNRESFAGQWGIAEVLRREHDLTQSRNILDGLIETHPEYAPPYLTRAYICYLDMDFERGVELTSRVLHFGETSVDLVNIVRAHALYAGCKGMLAHHGSPMAKIMHGSVVKRHLRIANELRPDDPAVCVGLGSYYMLIPRIFGKDLVKAKAYLLKAISLDPKLVLAYVRLAQVYQAQGDNEKYQEYMDKAYTLDPRDEIVLDIRNNTCRYLCVDSEK